MPKYIIHLGPSKTGTKYLQSTLFLSRESLLADGINYPDDWWTLPNHMTHDPLLHMLRDGRYAEVRDTFSKLNSGGSHTIVLSCEGLADLTPEQFAVLRDAIGNNPIEVVYYCRRWTERIPSDWKQSVQMGMFATLPEFYAVYIQQAFYSGSVNYSLVWARVVSIFGRKSLKLVSYSDLRDQRTDIFRHFAKTFLNWDGEITARRDLIMDQASPKSSDVEILRVLNWIDYQAVGRHRWNMRLKFSRFRSEFNTSTLETLMANDLGTLELSDGAEVFRSSWKEMKKYADCLVPRTFVRARPFELRAASIGYVRGNYLLQDRATQELRSLYQRVDAMQYDGPGMT
jgi:hypothetical protein